MQTVITTGTIEKTHELARSIMQNLPQKTTIMCLSGDLGSGKTTFTQGILYASGAPGPYTSPTFTIIKEYVVTEGFFDKIYHIDAYRIGVEDMIELGWYDMIAEERTLIIVEWPERIECIIPQDAVHIACTWIDEAHRQYTFDK